MMLIRVLVLLTILLGAPMAARAAEPEALRQILDLIAAKTGVRPSYSSLQTADNVVTLRDVVLSVKNPVEPDDRNETRAAEIVLRGLRSKDGVVTANAAEISGLSHQRSVFSMEVLQIDGLFAELGVDPPGSIGRSVDDKIAIGRLEASGWTLDSQAAMEGRALPGAMGVENLRAENLLLNSGGTPLAAKRFSMELQRRRSAGPYGRHYALEGLELTAPWLLALFGTAPAELGYDRVKADLEAQTRFEADAAKGSASIKAAGAAEFHVSWDLAAIAIEQLVPGASLQTVLAASPSARIEAVQARYGDLGATERMMQLLARQTGAARADLAGALAAQAAAELRRAGFRRVAGEAETALAELLGNGRSVVLMLGGAPLAALAGTNAAGLEKAGLTVRNGR